MSHTITLTSNNDAFLFQMGAVMYQGRLHKTTVNISKFQLQLVQDFVNHMPDRVRVSIFEVPETNGFAMTCMRVNEDNTREGMGINIPADNYPKYKWMRPWWVMIQRAWRASRQMRKTHQACFEVFVLGTHARLGRESVVQMFPVDLLGLLYNKLLPSKDHLVAVERLD